MANDRTRTRTGAGATVDMNDGSNVGKEMTVGGGQQQRPTPGETAQQRAWRQAREFRDHLVGKVQETRPTIESFLRVHGVDWEFFVSNLLVGLEGTMKNDRDFFDPADGVTVSSFIDAVVRASKDGLPLDGKKAAVARFKRAAQYMPMVEGFCDILYATGFVKAINHNVVRDCDEIDHMEGDEGYVRQKKPFKRPPNAETVGAWCVIELTTGGKIIEICDDEDLRQIGGVSKATKGPRADWADEMHRKGPFRRAMKRAPKNARLAQVLKHDDDNYDLTLRVTDGPAKPLPPREALLSDKAHVPEELHAQATHPDRTEDRDQRPTERGRRPADPPSEQEALDGDDSFSPDRAAAILRLLSEIEAAEGGLQLGAIGERARSSGLLEACTEEETDRINAAIAARAAALAAQPAPTLCAILSRESGQQEFADPRVWEVELLTKIGSLEGRPLQAFWALNLPHVHEALDDYPDHAGRVLQRAEMAGLPTEAS